MCTMTFFFDISNIFVYRSFCCQTKENEKIRKWLIIKSKISLSNHIAMKTNMLNPITVVQKQFVKCKHAICVK